jgi:hypothetical protein
VEIQFSFFKKPKTAKTRRAYRGSWSRFAAHVVIKGVHLVCLNEPLVAVPETRRREVAAARLSCTPQHGLSMRHRPDGTICVL